MKKILFLNLLMALSLQACALTIDIDNCQGLNVSGAEYLLTEDITDSDSDVCMNFLASDIALDCQGHKISGLDGNNTYGIYSLSPVQPVKISVKNCVLENWFLGIGVFNLENSSFSNITISSSESDGFMSYIGSGNSYSNISISGSKGFGFVLLNISESSVANLTSTNNLDEGVLVEYSDRNVLVDIASSYNLEEGYLIYQSNYVTFNRTSATGNNYSGYLLYYSLSNTFDSSNSTGNNISGFFFKESDLNTIMNSRTISNAQGGMTLEGSTDNQIYNNLFNNTDYATSIDEGSQRNDWNTSKRAWSRVFSDGAYIGGNYWASPQGDGYSEICADTDLDGFCDLAYELAEGNIDESALSDEGSCPDMGDEAPCGSVTLTEVIDLISQWLSGEATLSQVISLVDLWLGS